MGYARVMSAGIKPSSALVVTFIDYESWSARGRRGSLRGAPYRCLSASDEAVGPRSLLRPVLQSQRCREGCCKHRHKSQSS
jgi:hypothetical protein